MESLRTLLEIQVERGQRDNVQPPEHHVTLPSNPGWASSFTSWVTQSPPAETIRFRNPWPSWHKPTFVQIWDNLQWGQEEPDACVELAASHLPDVPADAAPPSPDRRPSFLDATNWPNSIGAQAARLLRIEKPHLAFPTLPPDVKAKVTWLGHAGILVQLPPTDIKGSRPFRCLFDPIFSMRCSPSRNFGPIRSYPPPCEISDLPTIDAVFISHNHFDHLDLDTIMSVWAENKDNVRFFVPLGNDAWLVDCGIPRDHVIELDWWDSATLTRPGSNETLRIWCTPCQHSSGRSGSDVNTALWSSWFLEHRRPDIRRIASFSLETQDISSMIHPTGHLVRINERSKGIPQMTGFLPVRPSRGYETS